MSVASDAASCGFSAPVACQPATRCAWPARRRRSPSATHAAVAVGRDRTDSNADDVRTALGQPEG